MILATPDALAGPPLAKLAEELWEAMSHVHMPETKPPPGATDEILRIMQERQEILSKLSHTNASYIERQPATYPATLLQSPPPHLASDVRNVRLDEIAQIVGSKFDWILMRKAGTNISIAIASDAAIIQLVKPADIDYNFSDAWNRCASNAPIIVDSNLSDDDLKRLHLNEKALLGQITRDKSAAPTLSFIRQFEGHTGWFEEKEKHVWIPRGIKLPANVSALKKERPDPALLVLVGDDYKCDEAKLAIPSRNRVNFSCHVPAESHNVPSLHDLRIALSKYRGRVVCVVGHIDEKTRSFVTLVRKGSEEKFEVSLTQLEQIGKEFDIDFWFLGCKSSQHTQDSIGTLTDIFTVDMIDNFSAAIRTKNSITFMEVIGRRTANHEVELAITASAIERSVHRIQKKEENEKLIILALAGTAAVTIVFIEGLD
jgi:hypothetical protein